MIRFSLVDCRFCVFLFQKSVRRASPRLCRSNRIIAKSDTNCVTTLVAMMTVQGPRDWENHHGGIGPARAQLRPLSCPTIGGSFRSRNGSGGGGAVALEGRPTAESSGRAHAGATRSTVQVGNRFFLSATCLLRAKKTNTPVFLQIGNRAGTLSCACVSHVVFVHSYQCPLCFNCCCGATCCRRGWRG